MGVCPSLNRCESAAAAEDPDAGEIYRLDIKTGRLDTWKNILPRDRAGIMDLLLTFRVTPDGRAQAYGLHLALSNLYVADGLA